MRERISEAMKAAMKTGDKARLGTLRLMLSALKDRELGIGGQPPTSPLSETDVIQVLQKMVKQRRDSIETYKQGGRQDLVDQEAAEIKVIEEYLPRQMGETGGAKPSSPRWFESWGRPAPRTWARSWVPSRPDTLVRWISPKPVDG